MKRIFMMVLVSMVLTAMMAGVTFSSEVFNFVGTIDKFDRPKGEMLLIELKDEDDDSPAQKITIMDNERRVLRKNEELIPGVRLNIDYEKHGNANTVKKYKIIPGGC